MNANQERKYGEKNRNESNKNWFVNDWLEKVIKITSLRLDIKKSYFFPMVFKAPGPYPGGPGTSGDHTLGGGLEPPNSTHIRSYMIIYDHISFIYERILFAVERGQGGGSERLLKFLMKR